MVSLPFGLNEAALISALAIVVGVVAYGFFGSMLPAFTYSQYIYPILGISAVAAGIHLDHAIGDVLVGFGAALAGATIKGALPSTTT
jgi:hypothetical protein